MTTSLARRGRRIGATHATRSDGGTWTSDSTSWRRISLARRREGMMKGERVLVRATLESPPPNVELQLGHEPQILTREEMRGEIYSTLASWRRELWAEASGDMAPGASTPVGIIGRRILDLFFGEPCARCGGTGKVPVAPDDPVEYIAGVAYMAKPCPDCGEHK